MALLDTSFLVYDPDFADSLVLITRQSLVNNLGVNQLVETTIDIVGVVQSAPIDALERLPQGAQLSQSIVLYYNGKLSTESSPNGYADVVVWQGNRYQVQHVDETLGHYGGGFTKAICLLEAAHV